MLFLEVRQEVLVEVVHETQMGGDEEIVKKRISRVQYPVLRYDVATPGCLILDIHMPGLDGWETLQHLIKSGSNRRVIIISAEKNDGLSEKALKAGAVGFLQKPFNDQALVGLINIALEKKFKKKLN